MKLHRVIRLHTSWKHSYFHSGFINRSDDRINTILNVDEIAKLDINREARCGFPEVVFGSGKSTSHLIKILKRFYDNGNSQCIATRVSLEQYNDIKSQVSMENLVYNEDSKILHIAGRHGKIVKGHVAILRYIFVLIERNLLSITMTYEY